VDHDGLRLVFFLRAVIRVTCDHVSDLWASVSQCDREEGCRCVALELAVSSEVDASIVEALSGVPAIEHLFFESDATTWNVVVVVNSDSAEVHALVTDAEISLAARFPDESFYFHVIVGDGRPMRELARGLQPKWSRSAGSHSIMGWWAAACACMDWITPTVCESAQAIAQL
jgi:hypothetical protein